MFTTDPKQIGNYTATIEVDLVSFPRQTPLQLKLPIAILPALPNNLPYFSPKLASTLTIQKTSTPTAWSFALPKIVDADEGDKVSLTANFDSADFLTLNGVSSIECADISANIQAGLHLVRLTLDDGRDRVSFIVSVIVLEVPRQAVTVLKVATNDTATTSEESLPSKQESTASATTNVYSPYSYVPPTPKVAVQRIQNIP